MMRNFSFLTSEDLRSSLCFSASQINTTSSFLHDVGDKTLEMSPRTKLFSTKQKEEAVYFVVELILPALWCF